MSDGVNCSPKCVRGKLGHKNNGWRRVIFAFVHSGGAIVALVLVQGPVLVVVPLLAVGLRLES